MVTAKQRAWRKKFAARYGKKKKTRRARRVRVVKQRRRPYMARRRRRGRKGRRSMKGAIPVLPTVAAVYPAYKAYVGAGGITAQLPLTLVYQYTGYNMDSKNWNAQQAMGALGPVIVGFIGSKIASKVGVNRMIKKATFGYLKL